MPDGQEGLSYNWSYCAAWPLRCAASLGLAAKAHFTFRVSDPNELACPASGKLAAHPNGTAAVVAPIGLG